MFYDTERVNRSAGLQIDQSFVESLHSLCWRLRPYWNAKLGHWEIWSLKKGWNAHPTTTIVETVFNRDVRYWMELKIVDSKGHAVRPGAQHLSILRKREWSVGNRTAAQVMRQSEQDENDRKEREEAERQAELTARSKSAYPRIGLDRWQRGYEGGEKPTAAVGDTVSGGGIIIATA